MKILLIGSGGREHAIAWQCAKDDEVTAIFVAPGNAGTAFEKKCQNVTNLDINQHNAVIKFCHAHAIDMVIVGPEAPLVAGLVDACQAAGIKIWGPSQYCAQLEGSKTFAKQFMQKYDIPTADYRTFEDADTAKTHVRSLSLPVVIKADGLAAGKGVIVADSHQQACDTIDDMLSGNKFGDAGSRVVVEAFLHGEEASFICMVDGNNVLPMASSQDHKRVGEGDTGPNTGGMGAYSPAPVVTDAVHAKVLQDIIQPVVLGMQQEGHPYVGFLYAGLMIDEHGDPKVIEFNCRFGDPETQPIMMRLQASLPQLIKQGLLGRLPAHTDWDERSALGIVLASKGYPESSSKGDVISGLPDQNSQNGHENDQSPSSKVFHAGTKCDGQHIVTNGGRVLCVTVLAQDISDAQQLALTHIAPIRFDGAFYRRDIGHHAITR